MALVIRLTKLGKKGEAKYRVIVKEKRDKRDGKALEYLGNFEKLTQNRQIKNLKKDRINYWISVGAKCSPTVKKLLES